MARQDPLQPGYEEGRSYLVSGILLNRIVRAIRRRILPGTGIRETETPSGILWSIDPSAASASHPFKMSVRVQGTAPHLYMHTGIVEFPAVGIDGAGGRVPYWRAEHPLWEGGSDGLTGNPEGTPEGSMELEASTTYGVWLRVKMASASTALSTNGGLELVQGDSWYGVVTYCPGLFETPRVVVSDTATERYHAGTLVGTTNEFGYFYLGKVTVDGEGTADIAQYRSSDLTLPLFSMPEQFQISGDQGNLLTTGTDAKPMLDRNLVVTSITGNAPVVATDEGDGLWTIEIEDGAFVTSISGGTDISATDNGDGSWTISYTGT